MGSGAMLTRMRTCADTPLDRTHPPYCRFAGAPWKEAGTNVFITAGAGGTGHVAIQMAKAWGGNVTAVGGPRDEAFILQMGADRFIDYTKDANVFATVAADSVDVVYDNYGGAGTADQAMPALRQGGAFVFLPGNGGALSKHPKKGVKQINFGFVDSTKYADLDTLKVLADGGKLKPHLQAVFPMAELVAAFNLSMSGTVQGKIGIQIPGQCCILEYTSRSATQVTRSPGGCFYDHLPPVGNIAAYTRKLEEPLGVFFFPPSSA